MNPPFQFGKVPDLWGLIRSPRAVGIRGPNAQPPLHLEAGEGHLINRILQEPAAWEAGTV